MSFIGKLLIGAQVVLSILFMFIGGAVFFSHTNWKSAYDKKAGELATANQNLQGVRDNAEAEKTALTTSLNDEKGLRLTAETNLATAQTAVAALTKDKNDLQAQIQTQTGIAETKANEASYRDEEAQKQRIINADLQKRLDENVLKSRQLDDQVFTLKADLAELSQNYNTLLATKTDLEKVVAKAGLDTDPRSVARLQTPPPPVDGVVKEVRKDRTNRPHLAVISIGSDDGLEKGHELDAWRAGIDGQRPQWLGSLRVVNTSPDESVVEVVDSSKNGILEVGDNVTTKLVR